MTTSPVKLGNVTKYVCFDKNFKRVSEGDTYVMPGGNERKARKESWNRCLTTNGFTFSSPTKRRTGLGECTGNFSKFPNWEARGGAEKKTKDDIPPMPKPNILTNPTKKGSYGIPNTTLSKGSEYSYLADPYARARDLEQEEKRIVAEKTAAFTGGKPFNTMSHAKDCFDKTVYTDPEHLRGGYKAGGSARDLARGQAPDGPFLPPQEAYCCHWLLLKIPQSRAPRPREAESGLSWYRARCVCAF